MAPDRRQAVLVTILAATVLGTVVAPVGGEQTNSIGEPDIDVFLPDQDVTAGSEADLDLKIQNNGRLSKGLDTETVLTARGVTAEIDDAGPFEATSGTAAVGSIRDGQVVTAPLQIAVPEDIDAGTYDVTVKIKYGYTRQVSEEAAIEQRDRTRKRYDVTVRVDSSSELEITDVTTDVQPGTSGETTFTIENTGSEPVEQARATLSGSSGVSFDGDTAGVALGNLDAGDGTTVTVDTTLADDASASNKPVQAVFEYRDTSGVERESAPNQAILAPHTEQSFAITNLEDTLSVGYDGEITGTFVNDGPMTLTDGVLIAEPRSDSLSIDERRYALPPLKPGESVDIRYPTDVGGSADAGPRQLEFSLEYSNDGQSRTEVDPQSYRVEVDEKQDPISIAESDTTVTAGGSTEFVLEITNERPETLSDIDALLYTDSPLDSSDDEAYVDELEPGESAEITFDLSADEDAMTKRYPVELDFQYDTERGRTELSDTYQHPVDVTAASGGGFLSSTAPYLILLLTATVVGVGLWYRRS